MNEHSPGPWKTGGPVRNALIDVVDASDLLVLKVCVPDGVFSQECLANLRLVLRAPELLAVLRGAVDWYCAYGVNIARCVKCDREQNCPLVKAHALFKEIDGEEKPVAKRKREFAWEASTCPGLVRLWCDEKHFEAIGAVEGVAHIFYHYYGYNVIGFSSLYDEDEIKAEIEALFTGG